MTLIEQMLSQYTIETFEDERNAIKEIMQEVTLSGLARTDFFKHAAFYGGTALRMFHELDRFSEDLDFTLMYPNDKFDMKKYIYAIREAVESLGLSFEIKEKEKSRNSSIKSAFLKGNTKEYFLIFYPDSIHTSQINIGEKIRIKFEIDINPPEYASTRFEYRLLPYNYKVQLYDKPSLFAGKIHAVLARKWKTRVKGRDYYDYVYYLASNTPVNLNHLEARLKQTQTIERDTVFTLELLKEMLYRHFDKVDYKIAKSDVLPFIKNTKDLEAWEPEFFKTITTKLRSI